VVISAVGFSCEDIASFMIFLRIYITYQITPTAVDHRLLLNKLKSLNLPLLTKNWIIDFLSNMLDRLNYAFRNGKSVHSGVPQATKLGLWLYALMINNL
jgi:hypothetical protein